MDAAFAPALGLTVESIRVCRLCGSTHLTPVIDFGPRHMVDFPATADGMTKPPVPLHVLQCRSCSLVQLKDTAPSSWRYSTYYYCSGTNEAMRDELADVVATVRSLIPISHKSTVLDIGANDGTLLAAYKQQEGPEVRCPYRIAVEPAGNLNEALHRHATEVYAETWPLKTATLPKASVDAVTSIAMMYGADDLNAFTEEVARVLSPQGVWVVQFQDLLSVLQTNAVDWFVHEHLATFSLWSFANLIHRHGLKIVDVERRVINGGSLRIIVRKSGAATARVAAQIERERAAGLLTPGNGWGGFLARVALVKAVVRSTIESVVESGGTVDLYAASTKSILLLQLCDLDHRLIRQGIERQPPKWGRFVGDRGIPIVSEEAARADPATAWLLGANQFRNQFIERECEYLKQGGLMICPLPHPEIIREGR